MSANTALWIPLLPLAGFVFAGLLGLAVLFAGAVVGGTLLMPASQSNNSVVVSAPAIEGGEPAAPSDTVSISSDGTVLISRSDAEGNASGHTSVATLPSVDAKLLLVPMLPQPIEPDLMKSLINGTQAMAQQGVDFVGSVLPGVEEEAAIDMTASLRNALGSTPTDSSDYPLKVKSWLETQPLDGVLVLFNRPSDPSDHRALLVTDLFHSDMALNDQAVPGMLNVLAGNGYTPQD